MSAVNEAMAEVVEQARNVIEANEKRAEGYEGLTLSEGQEIAVLYIRLEALEAARGKHGAVVT